MFFSNLKTSYIIQSDKIIKGTISIKAYENSKKSLALQAALISYLASNVFDASNASRAVGIKNLFIVWNLICLNMQDGFAQQFFFTELYKRKEYPNPRLIEETKHYYIYLCDNKKLKIRKIYTSMNQNAQNVKGISILKRVLRFFLIFTLFSFISIVDLTIGLSKNDIYIHNIEQSYSQIETDLANFGYQADKIHNTSYRFKKIVSSQRTSYIQYFLNLDGTTKNIEFEIYFNQSSDNFNQEIKYILTALNDSITRTQMEKFIQDTQSTI